MTDSAAPQPPTPAPAPARPFHADASFWVSLAVVVLSALSTAGLIPASYRIGSVDVGQLVTLALAYAATAGYDMRRSRAKLEGLALASKPWWKRTEALMNALALLAVVAPSLVQGDTATTGAAAVLAVLRAVGFARNTAAVSAAVADPNSPAR